MIIRVYGFKAGISQKCVAELILLHRYLANLYTYFDSNFMVHCSVMPYILDPKPMVMLRVKYLPIPNSMEKPVVAVPLSGCAHVIQE